MSITCTDLKCTKCDSPLFGVSLLYGRDRLATLTIKCFDCGNKHQHIVPAGIRALTTIPAGIRGSLDNVSWFGLNDWGPYQSLLTKERPITSR